ncbi:hypothetical protein BV25DRAFT_1900967 [Artomyces pyxidatus]|uniref:Uncharacterized protein n=1 Tax=Artomyces pyxidatus TaxID=48021 RepID=A0ACB8SWK6_9AGAM|nr:hypothetical protein BV25DRAFT_1900967 [Artomyces pyxidatus]
MALNAICSVTLEGGATSEFLPVTLHRMTAPLNLVSAQYDPLVRPSLAPFLPESVPERPPSCLPPPGTAQLHCHAGKSIGDGHSSIILALNDVELDGAPPDERFVPRLVVKIARSNRLAALARNAWFYDEMECLQGSSIARCYGWFETELFPNQIVPAWSDHPAEETGDYDNALDHDATVHPDQLKRTACRDVISILVLERLGDRLPPGPHSKEDRKDILSLYEDASHLGVGIAHDVRRHNILELPMRSRTF